MTDTKQENSYDESFWNDVDALRAMLDAEDQEERDRIQNMEGAFPAFSQGERASYQELHFQPDQVQPAVEEHFEPRGTAERQPVPGIQTPSRVKTKRKSGGRGSLALVITLYIIIFAELAAIGAVAYQWYLWMQ